MTNVWDEVREMRVHPVCWGNENNAVRTNAESPSNLSYGSIPETHFNNENLIWYRSPHFDSCPGATRGHVIQVIGHAH